MDSSKLESPCALITTNTPGNSHTVKRCRACNQEKEITEFRRVGIKSSSDGRYTYCNTCHNEKSKAWHHRNKKKVSISRKAILHRVSPTVIKAILKTGKCAICNSTEDLKIDHCHKTKKIRGLLCSRCNLGIGLFDDNPERLTQAAKYVLGE